MSRRNYRSRTDWEDLADLIAMAVVVAVLGALAYFVTDADWSTCYGIEPDGERETIFCPEGWQDGETRNIQEDEFPEFDD
jgi:hypothetical protein